MFDKVIQTAHRLLMALDEKVIAVRIDRHHKYLLDGLTEFEHLGQSECIRRALRHYCAALGVEPKVPPMRKRGGRKASS